MGTRGGTSRAPTYALLRVERLYRAMRSDSDGHPLLLPAARGLGVRPEADIPINEAGNVEPGTGGMSVAVRSPMSLPGHRRPPTFGGTGLDSVWEIGEEDLSDALALRLDEPPPDHGLVEPAWEMSFEDFQDALAETRESWSELS